MSAWQAWLVQGCGTEAAYARHRRTEGAPVVCGSCREANRRAVERRRLRPSTRATVSDKMNDEARRRVNDKRASEPTIPSERNVV